MRLSDSELRWLCRHAALAPVDACPPATDAFRWDAVLDAAREAGVAPLIHHSLTLRDDDAVPDAARQAFRQAYEGSLMNTLRYASTLASLVSTLRERGVEVVLLKGLDIAHRHYPDPALRPIRDLDIFIRLRDFRAIRALMDEWGFEIEFPEREDVPIMRGQRKFFQRSSHRVLQFHWEYINHPDLRAALGTGLEFHRFWESVEPLDIEGVTVNVPPLERVFPYMCVHAAHHHQLTRLLWLCDLHRMLTGPDGAMLREQVLPRVIGHPGTRPAVHYALKVTRDLLGATGLDDAIAASRPRRRAIRVLCGLLRPDYAVQCEGTVAKMRKRLFRYGMKLRDATPGAKLRVTLVSINMPKNYGMAVEYLRLYALENAGLRDRVAIRTLQMNRRLGRYLMLTRILVTQPRVVGFSCCVWSVRKSVIVARLLKRVAPGVKVVFGGQEVTRATAGFMAQHPCIDVTVDGEGEATFAELLTKWSQDLGAPLDDVRGIVYRDDGRVVRTPERPLIEDLDAIGSPYLTGRIAVRRDHHLGAMLELCRGCRYRCAFCFEANKYPRVRRFSVDRVEREANLLFAQGVRYFHIMDPILGNAEADTLEALRAVFQRLQDEDPCEISVEVFAERIDDATLRCLEPFTIFDVGLQSKHPAVLRNIHRLFQRERFVEGVRRLQELGRQVNVYLILGLPGETPASYLEGVRFATSLDPSFLFLNQLCVLNGTELRDKADAFGLVYDERPPYEIIETPDMTRDDLRRLRVFSDALYAEHNLKIGR